MLTANPNLTAIYSACGPPALGAIQSIKNAGIKSGGIILVGFDGLTDEVKAVKGGCENATVRSIRTRSDHSESPLSTQLRRGRQVPKNVDTGTSLIAKANASRRGTRVSRRPSFAAGPFLPSWSSTPINTSGIPRRIPQPWMSGGAPAIDRTFEPRDLAPLFAACGVVATVLVQSAASDDDTDYMFEVAGAVDWVAASRVVPARRSPRARGGGSTSWQAARSSAGSGISSTRSPTRTGSCAIDGRGGHSRLLEERGLLLELPAVVPGPSRRRPRAGAPATPA